MKTMIKSVVSVFLILCVFLVPTGCTSKEEKALRAAQQNLANAKSNYSRAVDDYNELNDAIDNYYYYSGKVK